jgi:hypothetical protein
MAFTDNPGHSMRMLAIIALVAVTTLAAYRFAAEARTYWHRKGTDFGVYYRASMALNANQTPYDLEGLYKDPYGPFYKYPPLFAIALVPLARLGLMQAWHIWLVISLVIYLVAFLLLAHAESLGPRNPYFWLLATAFLLFQPSLDTLYGGQLDFVLLFLFILSYISLQQGSAGPPITGIGIALGTLLKLYPIIIVPWLLLKRFKAAVWVVVGLLGLTLLSAALAGWQLQVEYLTKVLPSPNMGTAWLENQAYFGFFARLWVNGATSAEPQGTYLRGAVWLSRGAAIITYLLSLAILLRTEHPRHGFTVLLPCMLLVLPAAWIHYEMILLLPIGIFLGALAHGFRRIPWPLLLLAFLLLAFGNEHLVLHVKSGLIQSYKFYGVFLMWLLGMTWAWRDQRAAPKLPLQAAAST